MSDNSRKQRRSALRLDVAVNGGRVCLAGSGRYGVLSLALTWVRHDPQKRPRSKTVEQWGKGECSLRIGALTGSYQESWAPLPLHKGDEIAIRVLGEGLCDLPPHRSRAIRPRASSSKVKKLALRNDSESGAKWTNEKSKDDQPA